MEEPRRRLLKGLPGPPVHTPLSWYTAQQDNALSGNSTSCGWLLSEGHIPPYIDKNSAIQSYPWVKESHKWLQEHCQGAQQGLDIHHQWHQYITEKFKKSHPELAADDTPAMRRPWVDAAIIDVQRTRGGVEIKYSATGLIAIGIHSGVNDRWIMPASLNWHRQHFESHMHDIAKHGFENEAGRKALTAWHTYCRQSINQQGGFQAWSIGDPFMKGWTSGRIHVSETPFSVVLYNIGALSLVDIFNIYPSHKDVFDYIRTHKRMDVLLDKIKGAQEQDPLGKKYPRAMSKLPVGILAVHGN